MFVSQQKNPKNSRPLLIRWVWKGGFPKKYILGAKAVFFLERVKCRENQVGLVSQTLSLVYNNSIIATVSVSSCSTNFYLLWLSSFRKNRVRVSTILWALYFGKKRRLSFILNFSKLAQTSSDCKLWDFFRYFHSLLRYNIFCSGGISLFRLAESFSHVFWKFASLKSDVRIARTTFYAQ